MSFYSLQCSTTNNMLFLFHCDWSILTNYTLFFYLNQGFLNEDKTKKRENGTNRNNTTL